MIEIMSMELGLLLQGLGGRECEFAAGASVFHLNDQVRVVHLALVQTLGVEPSRGLELNADHAESTAFQISGAVLFLTPRFPSLN